jgi:hypothetical protein
MKRDLLVTAVNQRGYTIQRHDGPTIGWVSILETPLINREAAGAYLDGMPRTPGAEYRVYSALKERA